MNEILLIHHCQFHSMDPAVPHPGWDTLLLAPDWILVRVGCNTPSGLAKGKRCRAIQMKNGTVVLQFDDYQARTLTRLPMEKTSNGTKFIRWQLSLRFFLAGTMP
jgi:hypothetical protein